ncbi:MAG: hypothetical protein GYA23_02990 [Methanomicrobiales archaeon]|nr:hypothetical protein [Methanomicrobiales archaeon]
MINFIISQKTLKEIDQDKEIAVISIPVLYLERKGTFLQSKERASFFTEAGIDPDDPIVILRMPIEMYKRFIRESRDGKLSLPEEYFIRYYKTSTDLNSHIKTEGNFLQFLPSENDPSLTNISNDNFPNDPPVLSTQAAIPSLNFNGENYEQMFEFRQHYLKTSANSFDYSIGQITPNRWNLNGAGTDKFDIYQEREYRFNSNEAIEIVVKFRDMPQGGKIVLFPTLFRNGASEPIPTYEGDQWDGYLPVDENDIPHAYGYHVQTSGGKYYIDIEDMNTLSWIGSYQESAAGGTTTFNELWGSSEYRQRSLPTSDSFSARTNPVIDEWVRVTNGNWQKPNSIWSLQPAGSTVSYVDVMTEFDSSGNLITRSYAKYP